MCVCVCVYVCVCVCVLICAPVKLADRMFCNCIRFEQTFKVTIITSTPKDTQKLLIFFKKQIFERKKKLG